MSYTISSWQDCVVFVMRETILNVTMWFMALSIVCALITGTCPHLPSGKMQVNDRFRFSPWILSLPWYSSQPFWSENEKSCHDKTMSSQGSLIHLYQDLCSNKSIIAQQSLMNLFLGIDTTCTAHVHELSAECFSLNHSVEWMVCLWLFTFTVCTLPEG